MKHTHTILALAVLMTAALFSAAVTAQNAPLRPPLGGFERPLADAPRRGNPGASPTLTAAEFQTLLSHWADYDANKNQRLDKGETPELFAKLFDAADANQDGALDEKERAGVKAQPVAQATPSSPTQARPSGPRQAQNPSAVPDPLKRAVFGDPIFGAPEIPKAAK